MITQIYLIYCEKCRVISKKIPSDGEIARYLWGDQLVGSLGVVIKRQEKRFLRIFYLR